MNSLETLTSAGQDERLLRSWSKDPTSRLREPFTKDSPEQLLISFAKSPPSSSATFADGPAAGGADVMRPSMELCPAHPGPETASTLDLKYSIGVASSPKEGPRGVQKGGEDEDEEENESDLQGCVFFSPDGSAYLLNGDDVQDGGISLGLSSQQFLPKGHPHVSATGEPPSTSDFAASSAPVTSFHIASSNQGFISNQIFQNTSSVAGVNPPFHSYHVTSIQCRSTANYLRKHTAAKKREESKENLEGPEEEGGNVEEDPVGSSDSKTVRPLNSRHQPLVWICLLCKRSFRHGKQLAMHATGLHGAEMTREEQEILALGDTSAVLQSLGKGKGTLISFLEPKTDRSSGSGPLSSSPVIELPNHTENLSNVATGMFSGPVNVTPAGANLGTTEGGGSMTRLLASSFVSSVLANTPVADEMQPVLQTSLPPVAVQDVGGPKPLENAKPPSCHHLSQALFPSPALEPSLDLTPWSPKALCDPTQAKDLALGPEDEDDEELGWCLAEIAREQETKAEQETKKCTGTVTYVRSHNLQLLLPNQSLCGCSALHTPTNSCPKEDSHVNSTSVDTHGGEAEDQSNENTSLEDHDDHATSYSPPMAERTSAPPPGFGVLTNDDFGPNSGPSPFQSMSLSNHMSMLHSRNSCKTLKCPKCNWHYKYQQTLDVHMKEKHPESNSHCVYCNLGQQHPRLARGESYNCGYKPYRCEACNYSTTTKGNLSIHMQSDKHLANLQAFQSPGNGSTALPTTTAGSGCSATGNASGGGTFVGRSASPPEINLPSPQDKQPKQKASWHCKVCNYETNISRNLRIHMTSEKHMQNMLLVHQGLPMGLPGLLQPGPDLCQFYSQQALRQDQPMDHHLLLNGFQLPPAANRKLGTGFSASRSVSPETRVALGQGLGTTSIGATPQAASSSPAEDPALKAFRCLVCYTFTTDNVELLLYHASLTRSLPEPDWKEVSGDVHRCKLCTYGTQLKANFQLHLKTDKHSQKYQLVAHLREGGVPAASANAAATELQLGSFNQAPPLHLRCNLCDFESNGKEKMRLHVRGSSHGENFQVYKFLMDLEDSCGGRDPNVYSCRLCGYDGASKLGLLQHLHSSAHRESQAQWERTQLQAGRMVEEGLATLEKFISVGESGARETGKPVPTPPEAPAAQKEEQSLSTEAGPEEEENRSDAAESTPGQTTVFCCPYCSFVSPAAEQVRSHTVSQHAVQPKFRCPLCQEQLMGRPNLRFHLTHIHNVVSECVERLLLVASAVEPTFPTKVLPGTTLLKARDSADTSSSFEAPEEPKVPEDGSTEASSETPIDMPAKILDKGKEKVKDHAESEDFDEAERQVVEKEASDVLPCPLCRQRAESFPELREHLENEHPELSRTEIQQLCGPGGHSEEEEEEEEMEDTDEVPGGGGNRPGIPTKEGKLMPTDPEAAPITTPGVPLDARQPVSYRKSTNFALDKFLDPSRPYKCTVCKESFTQKNILLVHYNSVSHLHKMKKASIDPSLPSRAEVTTAQDKPFKCAVCRVSYNQSSTLEIHMRSVLHQTRSRVAKLEVAGRSTPDPNSTNCIEKSDNTTGSFNAEHGSKNTSACSTSPKSDNALSEVKVEVQSTDTIQKGLAVPGLPFVPPQMHLSLDLHRQASLLQSSLFAPPLLPPFPLGPETLLKLQQHQQQQLLLPFYLHDLKVNPELAMQASPSILSLPGTGSMLFSGGGLMKPVNVKDEPQQLMEMPPSSTSSSSPAQIAQLGSEAEAAASQPPSDNTKDDSNTKDNVAGTQEPMFMTEEISDGMKEEQSSVPPLGDSKMKGSEPEQATNAMPPPRIPTDVSRTASKALLENFGFELVIQYNEGKQHLLPAHPPLYQPQPAPPRLPRGPVGEHCREKLKCETCGKLFSNMLILKTHEEHVHRRFLPFEALSRYATQFRKSYDNMYAPKQPVVMVPSEATAAQKALQVPTEVAGQTPQLPIPLDFSLCPSFLMPPLSLQAVPPALPNVEELMSAGLAQAKTSEVAVEPDPGESRSPRTRITPEQLKVLWNYFDINNLPSEEKILQMSEHTGLAAKVVKHWFRNRLFKERQQDKDSPYNFSTPPSSGTALPEGEEATEGGAPQMPSAELSRSDRWGSRRFSRTKFSDFQFQALQSFFETSAYPKDCEVEKLSQLLGLPNRVVVVWFQNARQKARKNAADSPFHAGEKGKEPGAGDRCVMSGSKQSTCKKCHLDFLCIFKLIQHLKKCYNDQLADEEAEDDTLPQEPAEETCRTTQDPASATMPPEIETEVQGSQEDATSLVSETNDQEELQIEGAVGEDPMSGATETVCEAETVKVPPLPDTEAISEQPNESEKELSVPIPEEQPQPLEQSSTSPPPLPQDSTAESHQGSDSTNIYSCDQCQVSFATPEQLGKHQSLHILASTQLPGHLLDMSLLMFDHNSSMLAAPLLPSGFSTLPSAMGEAMAAANRKRKLDEDSLSPTESEAGYLGDEPPKDKRLRTTILPEQLEILHRWYMQDSNPTRKMLDRISEEVSLKKRVVQVWFQNTRARERKGQFRCVPPPPSPKPYNKFIPLGKPENLPRHATDTPPGPLMTNRSPSLQVLRDTAAFYYNAAGIHHSTAPAPSPRAIPSPCQNTAISQTFINKAETCIPAREPATPDPTPAEPADSATVCTEETTNKESGAGDPPPLDNADEGNQRVSPPLPAMETEAGSPGDLSDSSSLADPESPNPGTQKYTDSSLDALGQRRFRTQMSSLQLKIMKACYANYRTPTMSECELLGSEIGLQKRVIQVWFQNARAKEKKAKLQGLPPPMGLDSSGDTPRTECTYCRIKYDFYVSCRSHVFSRQHIARLREAIQKQLKNEIKYYDLAPATVGTVPQLKPDLKTGTSIAVPPATASYPPLGFKNASATLPRLTPVLLSGQQGPCAPNGGMTPFNTGSGSSLLSISAPAVLPTPTHAGPPKGAPDHSAIGELSSVPCIEKDLRASGSPQPSLTQKTLPDTPILSSLTVHKTLKTMQTAIAGVGGAPPLLGGQFLPFPLPGTPPMFSPQVQGAYFQQLYGMKKGLFPMNPVIPQTLIGLLPNTLAPPEAPKPLKPASSVTVDPLPEAEEAAQASGEDLLLLQSAGVSTVDVAHRYLCRRCRAAFDDEGQAAAHQDETCFLQGGAQSPLRVPVCTYHCLSCQVLVNGTEALSQHLRSSAHKRHALRQNNPTFAKEEANIPHADPGPNPVSTSVLLAL
ncbi:zinc finger homeobox protein 2 [Ambystoma mexicanum]|uniref:zinc finger homeobox protein 2 n=1 Tax=Ambystoma mexicanum TaxID=8296 RepID=UPI0037E9A6AC